MRQFKYDAESALVKLDPTAHRMPASGEPDLSIRVSGSDCLGSSRRSGTWQRE